jgi:hypothetical protein
VLDSGSRKKQIAVMRSPDEGTRRLWTISSSARQPRVTARGPRQDLVFQFPYGYTNQQRPILTTDDPLSGTFSR